MLVQRGADSFWDTNAVYTLAGTIGWVVGGRVVFESKPRCAINQLTSFYHVDSLLLAIQRAPLLTTACLK